MTTSNIKMSIQKDITTVWETVLTIENYPVWRSDVSKIEIVNDKKFMEYSKDGYVTIFTITAIEPYKRWEFDIENDNMSGHWIGLFTAKGNETEIDFTEIVTVKKMIMKPFVKSFLKKQQTQFIDDLKNHVNK